MKQALEYSRERIVLADALRGFALMGLFIVHMVEYFELYWYRPSPGWVHNTVFFLFGGKAYGLFALLFGLSFYIILDNAEKRGVDFRGRFIWRITLLLLCGYIHSLLYAGDILQILSLCGLLLVVSHQLSNRTVFFLAVLFLSQAPTLLYAAGHYLFPNPNYAQPKFIALMAANFEVFANGSFSELLRHNLVQGQAAKWAFFLETGRLWNVIGLMFAGVYLGRTNFFERKHSTRLMAIGLLLCVVGYGLLLLLTPFSLDALALDGMVQWLLSQALTYLQNLMLIATWVALFVIAFNTSAGSRVLGLWAASGRMTLSLYLLQSILFVPLYYGFGFSAYQTLGQLNSLFLGVGLWGLQMLAAVWYLNQHRYGPVEKLWRTLTHYRWSAPKNL